MPPVSQQIYLVHPYQDLCLDDICGQAGVTERRKWYESTETWAKHTEKYVFLISAAVASGFTPRTL